MKNNLEFGKRLFYSDFDNPLFSMNVEEPMFSVSQDFSRMADLAVEYLSSMEQNDKIQTVPHKIHIPGNFLARNN